jgi:hypothetical protein
MTKKKPNNFEPCVSPTAGVLIDPCFFFKKSKKKFDIDLVTAYLWYRFNQQQQTENTMVKLAKDIQIGDTVKNWAFYITVQNIERIQQKNGKWRVKVTGQRSFKSSKEEQALVKEYGDAIRINSYTYGETTKVTYK